MAPSIEVLHITTPEDFVELMRYVRENEFTHVSLDLETNSRNEKTAKIFGIGLCFQDDEAFYIPIRNNKAELWWSEERTSKIYQWVYSVCRTRKLIGWNIIYDVLVFEYNSGLNISDYIYSDGILLKHAIDEERPFGLKETAVKYLGEWADKAQAVMLENIKLNGGKTTKDEMEMWKCDTTILGDYCGWDTVLTRKLFDIFERKLEEEGLTDLFYKEETMPLYREVTIDMKRKGFHVDVEYFRGLKSSIESDITRLEKEIVTDVEPLVEGFCTKLINRDYPVSRAGSYPKVLAEWCGIPLPKKNDKVTLAKKEVELSRRISKTEHWWFYDWLLGSDCLPPDLAHNAQKWWLKKDNPERNFVFNLKSNDHLGHLFFERLGYEPLSKTEGGKPQCDDDFLDSIKDEHEWIKKLIDYKKLIKLSSTYIDGILERQIDGIVYTSMLQFGTTSGRYSSRDPNLQNIPRVKDEEANLTPLVLHYTNAIKRGFVAPPGYKILNADYSSLEPVCFAHMSGDEKLREVFRKGFDLYSAIAIEVFGISGCSANKKDSNYLKNKHPELRQKAKIFCLAVVYGAEAGRISQAMNIDYNSAENIIQNYLDAFPELKNYMDSCDSMAMSRGYVRTEFGRIRHLPVAKHLYREWGNKLFDRRFVKANGLSDIRYKFKNTLNNGKNFPIQGLAAHIVNRAMIATSRAFIAAGIDGWIAMSVHDEVCCVVRTEHILNAKDILKYCMEHTIEISVPLSAEPLIADNWADAK